MCFYKYFEVYIHNNKKASKKIMDVSGCIHGYTGCRSLGKMFFHI